MELAKRLSEKKQEITRLWIDKLMESYPAESVKILMRNKNQFANPLPHTISESLRLLFDEILKGVESERVRPILDEVVRIRAVQDFEPSSALSFVFKLKDILRDLLKEDLQDEKISSELRIIEGDIDQVALLSFDIYISCRQRLFEIKANEIRNQTHMLIRRVNEMDKQKEAR